MKRVCQSSNDARQRGTALLAALCFATVLLIAIGSYITVCHRSLTLSARSLHGNRSIELAEAGMEEALWALNKNDWTDWTISGTTATKTISGFTFESAVTGTIELQIASYDGSAGARVITGTGRTVNAEGTQLARTIRATADRAPVFVNAIASTTGLVRLSGAGASTVIDSYDSQVGTYASQSPGYAAVISAGSTASDPATVQLTNAQVKGYVATVSTGPSYSGSARVIGPTTPGSVKIDTSRLSTSPYQPIFDILTVSGTGETIEQSPNRTIGTPGATTPSIYYATNGIDMRGNPTLTIDGPVKLVVSGSFHIGKVGGGSPEIVVTSNGTLETFVSGDIFIGGDGIVNQSGLPDRVAIYGSYTGTTASEINTGSSLHGVIYLPGADLTVTTNNAIYGAIVARNVTFSGTAPVVHYDLNLRRKVFSGIDTPFSVSDWRETTNDS